MKDCNVSNNEFSTNLDDFSFTELVIVQKMYLLSCLKVPLR